MGQKNNREQLLAELGKEIKRADLFAEIEAGIQKSRDFFEQLVPGTQFWIPCGGNQKKGNIYGHTGRVATWIGLENSKPVWEYGHWITRTVAQDLEMLGSQDEKEPFSTTICDECQN